MSVLWNTNESERGVLIQAASALCVNKSRGRSEFQPAHLYALQHTDGFFSVKEQKRTEDLSDKTVVFIIIIIIVIIGVNDKKKWGFFYALAGLSILLL